ncbi:hypothetical protein EYF80_039075 [Liparis tanakae]|uniref:Uncharacterized protein n=1 Tax=Liparis tanakae TaxID=230148 RepID=A0A4Z2GDG2_9TELE|nr:hypothetical protein EYF80_039075 [Liparis tanakae]
MSEEGSLTGSVYIRVVCGIRGIGGEEEEEDGGEDGGGAQLPGFVGRGQKRLSLDCGPSSCRTLVFQKHFVTLPVGSEGDFLRSDVAGCKTTRRSAACRGRVTCTMRPGILCSHWLREPASSLGPIGPMVQVCSGRPLVHASLKVSRAFIRDHT